MTHARKLLVGTGLAAALFAGLGAGGASAQESPGSPGSPGADVPVVHDPGLDGSQTRDSAPDLQGCYAGEKYWDAGLNDTDGFPDHIPGWDDAPDSAVGDTPVYLASPRCEDVNVRIISPRAQDVRAWTCFYPTSTPDFCNQGTVIPAGDTGWHLVATDLIDGTRFTVHFDDPGDSLVGYIAY